MLQVASEVGLKVFSYFEYKNSCGGKPLRVPTEPLVGLFRHPLALDECVPAGQPHVSILEKGAWDIGSSICTPFNDTQVLRRQHVWPLAMRRTKHLLALAAGYMVVNPIARDTWAQMYGGRCVTLTTLDIAIVVGPRMHVLIPLAESQIVSG